MNENNDNIQILVDAWEQRPRRQLDYSGLTESSVADLEWTNNMIKSLIKAVPDIREKFGVHPTAEIVMPFTIKPPSAAPQDGLETILTHLEGSWPAADVENASMEAGGQPNSGLPPAIRGDQGKAAGSDVPSKKASKAKGKGRSTGSRSKKLKAARSGEVNDHKQGISDTLASEPAKPAEELPVALQAAPSSGPAEALAANPPTEIPPVSLMSIG